MLTEGVYLVVNERFVPLADVGKVLIQSGLIVTPPDDEEWARFAWDGDRRNKAFGPQTTVESLRDLPPWLYQEVVPLVLGGRDVQLLPLQGQEQEGVWAWGWFFKERAPRAFWARVVHYLAS